MADQEFEEFSDLLDALPQHFKATDHTYKLVHAITPLEENKSFLEKVKLGEKLCGLQPTAAPWTQTTTHHNSQLPNSSTSCSATNDETSEDTDEELLPSVKTAIKWSNAGSKPKAKLMPSFTKKSLEFDSCPETEVIQIMRKRAGNTVAVAGLCKAFPTSMTNSVIAAKSLHEELAEAAASSSSQESIKKENFSLCLNKDPTGAMGNGESEDSVDSGNSTSHSPAEDSGKNSLMLTTSYFTNTTEGCKSMSSSMCTVDIEKPLELLDPTHRGLHRFIPRHPDEIEVDIGDPVYVQKEAEDLWCEGVNLRTGDIGIFPLAHVVDVDYNDFDNGVIGDDKKERYLLDYLGSVETSLYKGNIVLCQAIRKISQQGDSLCQARCTVLEISDKGIKMLDKSKTQLSPGPDYFFHLKNVTFCGFHPREPRFFGFVTKHPQKIKYACHVFLGQRSTQHVAEACGTTCADWNKVNDGVCDQETNVAQCIFDGGDCIGWFFAGPFLLQHIPGHFEYSESIEICANISGQIFEPTNASHLALIDSLGYFPWEAGSDNFWVGINDLEVNGEYVYQSSGELVSTFIDDWWLPLQPDNIDDEPYVSGQIPEFMFSDRPADYKAQLICQKS